MGIDMKVEELTPIYKAKSEKLLKKALIRIKSRALNGYDRAKFNESEINQYVLLELKELGFLFMEFYDEKNPQILVYGWTEIALKEHQLCLI
jgi:hypothetical protein